MASYELESSPPGAAIPVTYTCGLFIVSRLMLALGRRSSLDKQDLKITGALCPHVLHAFHVPLFLIYQAHTALFCVPKNLVLGTRLPDSQKGRTGSPKVTNHIGGCPNSGSSQERSQVLPRHSRSSLMGTLACVFVNHLQDHWGAMSSDLQL